MRRRHSARRADGRARSARTPVITIIIELAGSGATSHIQTVQSIYEAFGRGDIATILGHLAEDVEWEYDKADTGVPWLVPRRGRAQVPKFFEALGAVEFQKFRPKVQLASGNIVVGLNDVAFTVKATGKRVVEEDEVHIWHFDASGKVARFCHKTDTLQQWLALQGG